MTAKIAGRWSCMPLRASRRPRGASASTGLSGSRTTEGRQGLILPPLFFALSLHRLRQFGIIHGAFAPPIAASGGASVEVARCPPIAAVRQVRQICVDLLTTPSLFASKEDWHRKASGDNLPLECGFRHVQIGRCRFSEHHRGPIGELATISHRLKEIVPASPTQFFGRVIEANYLDLAVRPKNYSRVPKTRLLSSFQSPHDISLAKSCSFGLPLRLPRSRIF